MRTIFILVLCFISSIQIFADIPKRDFVILDRCEDKTLRLGDDLSVMFEMYPSIAFRGERKYSNRTMKEYQAAGIIFSISALAESEKDANVLIIEILSERYLTQKGFKIGSSMNDVVSTYGPPRRYVGNNSCYYVNSEGDTLVLEFIFNDAGIITSIVLSAGT